MFDILRDTAMRGFLFNNYMKLVLHQASCLLNESVMLCETYLKILDVIFLNLGYLYLNFILFNKLTKLQVTKDTFTKHNISN